MSISWALGLWQFEARVEKKHHCVCRYANPNPQAWSRFGYPLVRFEHAVEECFPKLGRVAVVRAVAAYPWPGLSAAARCEHAKGAHQQYGGGSDGFLPRSPSNAQKPAS